MRSSRTTRRNATDRIRISTSMAPQTPATELEVQQPYSGSRFRNETVRRESAVDQREADGCSYTGAQTSHPRQSLSRSFSPESCSARVSCRQQIQRREIHRQTRQPQSRRVAATLASAESIAQYAVGSFRLSHGDPIAIPPHCCETLTEIRSILGQHLQAQGMMDKNGIKPLKALNIIAQAAEGGLDALQIISAVR